MFTWQLCLRKRDLRTIGAAGNIIIDMGVLLSEDFNRSTQRNCRAMGSWQACFVVPPTHGD
jgi:hypothetical protein